MAIGNVQLTPDFVQRVRDTVDVLDIAGEHTKLIRTGKNHKGLCPLHKEKTPSFSVDPDRGVFYCFGCGQGGDAIRLHQLLSGDDFPAAMESLATRYGVPLPTGPARGPGGRSEPDLEAPLLAAQEFFVDQLKRNPGPREYLRKRRIPQELIEGYGLGFAPDDWRQLLRALEPRVPIKDLMAAGLVAHSDKSGRHYDRFRNRLMFPIHNAAGRLMGFGGRALGDDKAKYINTSETARFRKGWILYGLDVAKRNLRESRRAFLVEGYFDVLGAAAAGIEGAVASMGTSLTPEQSKLLARFADEVVVGYDGDKAGEEASRRALPLLLGNGLGVLRPHLDEGHDPDSLRLEKGPEELVRVVEEARDALTQEIERLTPPSAASEPRHQARAANAIVSILKPIPDRILRYGYARQAAERLGVPAEILLKQGGRTVAAQDRGQQSSVREVRSVEEKLLQLLLQGPAAPPGWEDLPPEDAFLDASCRNIFNAFRDLYKEHGGWPEAKAVLARLPEGGEAVDRAARLLVEGTTGSRSGELGEAIQQLMRRWQRQKARELSVQISEAERLGDNGRMERLLGEKNALGRSLHGRTGSAETGGPEG